MKSKKTMMTLGVIVAVLVLGIGYASITSIGLNITGNAAAEPADANFKVEFTGEPTTTTSVSDNSTGAKVSAGITSGTVATIEVSGLTAKGDTVTATYTISNKSTAIGAKVTLGTITVLDSTNNTSGYFKVTTDWNSAQTIASGSSTTVKVTVELVKTPLEEQSAKITIPFTAEAVAE